MTVPACYKVTISDFSIGKSFVIKDVVADGYIQGEGARFFITLEGVRFEVSMASHIVVKFSKERDQIIRARDETKE